MPARLEINRRRFSDWDAVMVTQSLENACSGFQFVTFPEKSGISARSNELSNGNAACKVLLNDTPILTGWVETPSPEIDKSKNMLSVAGRSKTCDLVDCSALAMQFKNERASRIASVICAQFGIYVQYDLEDDPKIKSFSIEFGESAHAALSRLFDMTGAIITDTPDGDCWITRAAAIRSHDNLIEGENMEIGKASFSFANRYSEIHVFSQRPGNDHDFGRVANQIHAMARDESVARYRPYYMVADTGANLATCQLRADWEIATRAGRSQLLSVNIPSWTQKNGELWRLNQVVKTKAPSVGIEKDMLVYSIDYVVNKDAETARLGLMPPSGYLPEPKASKKAATVKPTAIGGMYE